MNEYAILLHGRLFGGKSAAFNLTAILFIIKINKICTFAVCLLKTKAVNSSHRSQWLQRALLITLHKNGFNTNLAHVLASVLLQKKSYIYRYRYTKKGSHVPGILNTEGESRSPVCRYRSALSFSPTGCEQYEGQRAASLLVGVSGLRCAAPSALSIAPNPRPA